MAVRQLTVWMLGYSPKLISAPGFACVMSSYLSQRGKVILAYVRTRLPFFNCLFFVSLANWSGNFDTCAYLAFFLLLLCLPTFCKMRKKGYACTWLALNHVFLLIA